MSGIRQVGPNLWEASELMGVTPQLMHTNHAMKYYPNGEWLLHEPLHKERKVPLVASSEETKGLNEVFKLSSAGRHEGYLDMRVNSVTNRSGGFYMLGVIGLLFWWSFESFVLSYLPNDIIRPIAIYSGYAFFTIGALICLFRTLATPVRFHKKTKKSTYVIKKCFIVFLGQIANSLSK